MTSRKHSLQWQQDIQIGANMYDQITLITEKITKDSLGMSEKTYETLDVLCEVNSITRQEFFEAGRSGLNPAYEMTVFAGDYSGQKVIEYKGERYGVYRTYRTGDYMELYVERKGGVVG